mgnify:CR=1 FL=1
MSLIMLLVIIALIGLAAWALTSFVPMSPGFKKFIYFAAIFFVALFVLSEIGWLAQLTAVKVTPVPVR